MNEIANENAYRNLSCYKGIMLFDEIIFFIFEKRL